jgi:hypothetical protein
MTLVVLVEEATTLLGPVIGISEDISGWSAIEHTTII